MYDQSYNQTMLMRIISEGLFILFRGKDILGYSDAKKANSFGKCGLLKWLKVTKIQPLIQNVQ